MTRTRLAGLVLALSIGPPASAQQPATADRVVTTRHQIVVGGRPLRYAATAGWLPILDNETGNVHARIFFVAYKLDRAAGAPVRPLTFVWNGGPGANSSQVHLLGFGPRRPRTGDVYPGSPAISEEEILDNQETWLEFSDLVFVDPVGTGFSRPTKREYAGDFYNQTGDVESVADFIRVYRTRFDGWNAPLFLAGESYGTTRAMGVAEALERRRTNVAGVLLISGGFQVGQNVPREMETALQVPRYTAAAFYHRKLPSDLQGSTLPNPLKASEAWARNEYAPALARRDSLTPSQRSTVLAQLTRFTGIDSAFVDSRSLTISSPVFHDRLLQDRGLELGRYDSRMTAPTRNLGTTEWGPLEDPSLRPLLDLMQGTSPLLSRYFRVELKFETDLLYQGPFGEGFPPPAYYRGDWMSQRWNQLPRTPALLSADTTGGSERRAPRFTPPTPAPPLRRAMEINPRLRVFIVNGMYDRSCALADYTVSRLDTPLRDRVRAGCYAGGHQLYTDRDARRALQQDFGRFVRETLAGRG